MSIAWLDKCLVAENFSRASASYDAHASVQHSCAEAIVSMVLAEHSFDAVRTVIDIGAGSGSVIELLHHSMPGLFFIANDVSSAMLQLCAQKCSKYDIAVDFLLADAETYGFVQNYDLVISNFCFQWFVDLECSLEKMMGISRILFAFTTLLHGTFSGLQKAHRVLGLPDPLAASYPTMDRVMRIIERLDGCYLLSSALFRHIIGFKSAREFFVYLRALGANYSNYDYSPGHLRSLFKYLGNDFLMEYEVAFFVLAKKPRSISVG